ncbi:nucleotide pyrophosphohydrolase [Actinomyces radicidentis]|uniref:nucleotide pyrophosphohydrolase n=1 Tax=Actinomyces radicidentis TaxID=111015 RepID=UPI0026E0EFDD|nr:nucleotide pyrophosphohydrolase [Actinomyces radicidentis]
MPSPDSADASLQDVMAALRAFNAERDWDQFHSPENLAKSISIEAGELLECFQWGAPDDDADIREELADVLSYCLQMADRLGYDPLQLILDKLEVTRRKYPVELAKGRSTKYDRL